MGDGPRLDPSAPHLPAAVFSHDACRACAMCALRVAMATRVTSTAQDVQKKRSSALAPSVFATGSTSEHDLKEYGSGLEFAPILLSSCSRELMIYEFTIFLFS